MDEYSKGQIVHRTKRKAQELAVMYRKEGYPCRITKLARGYRVDRKY